MILVISPLHIILLVLVVPAVLFILGYWLGKKSGYNKRVNEEQE